MPIRPIIDEARTFLGEGNDEPLEPVHASYTLDFDGLTARWSPPEGNYPVGEGWRIGDHVFQPCFYDIEATYNDGQIDNKRGLRIAKLDFPALEELEWIEASPAETTMPGLFGIPRYNTARRLGGGDPYCFPQTSPWGIPGDSVGDGFFGFIVDPDLKIAVPKLKGDLQIYAVDLESGEKIWERLGFEDMPPMYAHGAFQAPGPFGAEDLSSWPTWQMRNFTPLGPGRPGHVLVHVIETDIMAALAPDWSRRLQWTVQNTWTGATYTLNFSLLAKWAWAAADPTGYTDPPNALPYCDLLEHNYTSWGLGAMAPTKGVEQVPQPRPGRYRLQSQVNKALDQALADCIEIATKLALKGILRPRVTTRIEEIDITTGETVSVLEGPPIVRTGQKNVSGVGTATRTDYNGHDVDGFPDHPNPPPEEDLDTPGRRFKHPGPEDGMAEMYTGGTYETRLNGPVFMVYSSGPNDWSGFPGENDDPISTCNGWASWYAMASCDSADFVVLGSPPGICVPSNSDGVFRYGDLHGDARFSVFRCYSPFVTSDDKWTKRALPWPFDPGSLCTDGSVAIFLPFSDSLPILGSEDQFVHPDSDWPSQAVEVARCHRIHCYELPEGGAPWKLLWELDTRALFGGETILRNGGRPHPCDGDVISNGVIKDGHLYCIGRGSNGQFLMRVRIRALLKDPEDPDSDTLEPAGHVTLVQLSDRSGLVDGENGVYIDNRFSLCALSNTGEEHHDTIMAHGPFLYGVHRMPLGKTKFWRF